MKSVAKLTSKELDVTNDEEEVRIVRENNVYKCLEMEDLYLTVF